MLLNGESGTGKEVLARFIHSHSKRSAGPFVAVNCAAIPEQMLEAVLFGHEKGAFTGAQARSVGKFEQANGGTLLLDEVTEMDLGLQAKLLRVLQEREVEPLGASKPVALDVRVLATSNRDLEQAVRDGAFREDLYYRLSVFPLRIPPLRERPGDIGALTARFVAARSARPLTVSPAALARLQAYAWPGNVRELENVVQRALLLADGELRIEPRASRARRNPAQRRAAPQPGGAGRPGRGALGRGDAPHRRGARDAPRRAPPSGRAARHQRSHSALQAFEDPRGRHSSARRSRRQRRGEQR